MCQRKGREPFAGSDDKKWTVQDLGSDQFGEAFAYFARRQQQSQGESEVPSETIGEMVMEALAHLDPVAYVRYASVYRDFRDTSDFGDFIEEAGKTKRSSKS